MAITFIFLEEKEQREVLAKEQEEFLKNNAWLRLLPFSTGMILSFYGGLLSYVSVMALQEVIKAPMDLLALKTILSMFAVLGLIMLVKGFLMAKHKITSRDEFEDYKVILAGLILAGIGVFFYFVIPVIYVKYLAYVFNSSINPLTIFLNKEKIII